MKIYDEIISAINYSRCLTELHIVERMLYSHQDDLEVKDFNELQLIIINKKEEWK